MTLSRLFFGERYLTKVAASYESADAARHAAQNVLSHAHLTNKQVQVVAPCDANWDRKVEPEGVGIWRTAIRSHVTLGAMGFAAGALLFGVLYAMDIPAIHVSPVLVAVVISTFGMIFGLMAAGAVTLRPDHHAVIDPVRNATDGGYWSVVVHAASAKQERAAVRALRDTGARVASTL